MKSAYYLIAILALLTLAISCSDNNAIDAPIEAAVTPKAKIEKNVSDQMLSSMTIAPSRLVLNSQGNTESILCHYSGYLGNTTIAEWSAELYFDGVKVADAFSFRYCYVDYEFLAEFDRMAIQELEYVKSLANTNVLARMVGYWIASDGTSATFDKTDYIYIYKPGKK